MTSERYVRCSHCRVVYPCLMSGGPGYVTNHTDPRYCPDCLDVVHKALASIPPKFECDWVEVSEVSLEQVLAWKRNQDAARQQLRSQGQLVGERVAFPLFDMTGERRERSGIVRGQDEFAGRTFEFRYWVTQDDDTPTDVTIREEVERNLETGELRPWRLM